MIQVDHDVLNFYHHPGYTRTRKKTCVPASVIRFSETEISVPRSTLICRFGEYIQHESECSHVLLFGGSCRLLFRIFLIISCSRPCCHVQGGNLHEGSYTMLSEDAYLKVYFSACLSFLIKWKRRQLQMVSLNIKLGKYISDQSAGVIGYISSIICHPPPLLILRNKNIDPT